jgi:thioredoxin reductase (NADPH)
LSIGVDVSGQTPGVFAFSGLVDYIYRLPITAAASGCSVAIDAEHYLQEGKT